MNISSECEKIVKRFEKREFTFSKINESRVQEGKYPYQTKEMLIITSYLQRRYPIGKKYRKKDSEIETIFYFRE